MQAVLEAATYAPSGMHLETWHFTAIQNADKLTELNERIKGAFAKSDEPRLKERGQSKTYCCYYHAPTLVIVSNEPTQWWAGMDCACAIENMFLAGHGIFGNAQNQVSSAPFGSAGILPITYGYIRMMGTEGLTMATKIPMKEKKVKDGTITIVK